MKFRIAIIFVLVIFVATGFIHQRHSVACALLDYSDFRNIDGVYIDAAFSSADTDRVLSALDFARTRNENTFGQSITRPTIMIAASTHKATSFGGNAYGATLKTALGGCIVIGPEGQNIDVMAHELMHAELMERIGFSATFFRLPVWFDEGLALMVDYRPAYDPDNIDLPDGAEIEVKNIAAAKSFYGQDDTKKYYQAARLAVGDIFERVDTMDLYALLQRVKDGESFEDVFQY